MELVMAARRTIPIPASPSVSIGNVEDVATQRALDQLVDAVTALQSARRREVQVVDLVIGTNVLRHGLGRAVAGYTLVPTVANAAFAHAIDTSNPNPELELWITVAGAAQPGAVVEVW